MSRPYRRRRSHSAPPPEPQRFTRRDADTFWAWDRKGHLLGYVYGQSHEVRYKAVHTNALTTVRDETSYWAWDERAWLLGWIVKRNKPVMGGRYDCYLPDGTRHPHSGLPEKTLGNAWKWLRASRPQQ